MKIIMNGKALTLSNAETNIATALTLYQQENTLPKLFALALNGNFVGQGQYAQTLLNAGDSVDIFAPIQGG